MTVSKPLRLISKLFIMKKLVNLKGVKTLNSEEQKGINGGFVYSSCHQNGRLCCINAWGYDFCDAGACGRWGCVWY